MADGVDNDDNHGILRMALTNRSFNMDPKPNHKRAMEVVDSVTRRELDRTFYDSLKKRREAEKRKDDSRLEKKKPVLK